MGTLKINFSFRHLKSEFNSTTILSPSLLSLSAVSYQTVSRSGQWPGLTLDPPKLWITNFNIVSVSLHLVISYLGL